MARVRLLHPEFFEHEGLARLPPLHRLLFQGLWGLADREGRLEDRPARIKLRAIPWDNVDPDEALWTLADAGFIVRYESADGRRFIAIPSWRRWQRPHPKEKPSEIPKEDEGGSRVIPRYNLGAERVEPSRLISTPSPPVSNTVSNTASSVSNSVAVVAKPEATTTAATTAATAAAEPDQADEFRRALASRLAVDPAWFHWATPEKVPKTRELIAGEVKRLGLERAIEAVFRRVLADKKKSRWLSYYVGALQDEEVSPEAQAPLPLAPTGVPEWDAARETLSRTVEPRIFKTWIAPLKATRDGEFLALTSGDPFDDTYIRDNYLEVLEEYVDGLHVVVEARP